MYVQDSNGRLLSVPQLNTPPTPFADRETLEKELQALERHSASNVLRPGKWITFNLFVYRSLQCDITEKMYIITTYKQFHIRKQMLFGQNYYNIQRFSETGNVRACKVLLLNVLPDYKRIKLPSSFNEILILAEFMNVFIYSKFQNASYLMLVLPYYH